MGRDNPFQCGRRVTSRPPVEDRGVFSTRAVDGVELRGCPLSPAVAEEAPVWTRRLKG